MSAQQLRPFAFPEGQLGVSTFSRARLWPFFHEPWQRQGPSGTVSPRRLTCALEEALRFQGERQSKLTQERKQIYQHS